MLLASPVSPSTLYAGTPENGVFITTDGAQTWTAANTGLSSSASGRQTVYTIYALATDGQYIYAATAAGLFYRNATAGTTWVSLTPTGSTTPIGFLAFDVGTKRLFAASNTTDGLSAPGVYSTALDTTSAPPAPAWGFHVLPLPAGSMALGALGIVVQPTSVSSAGVVVGVGNSVYSAPILAADQTLTWINGDPAGTMAGSTVTALTYSADFMQTHACSGGAAYYSGNALDAQPVWTLLTVPGSNGVSFNCNAFATVPIALGGSPQLALGTDQGAFASVDGINFFLTGAFGDSPAANGFAVATLPGAMSASVFVAGGFGVSAVSVPLFVGGANWVASNGPASVTAGGSNMRLNNANVVDSALIGSTLYAAADSMQYNEVFASVDSGATWSATIIRAALNPLESINALAPDSTRGILYAATTQGLLAYSSASAQWSAVTAFNFGSATALEVGASSVFVGTDNGIKAVPLSATPASAMPVAAGLSGTAVKRILVSGGTVYAGVIDAVGNSVVYTASESTVAAGTAVWTLFGTGNLGTNRVTGLVLVSGQLLASTSGGLVHMATSGSAWTSANTSMVPSEQISDAFGIVNALYTDGTSVYAATGNNGMFVAPVGTSFVWTSLNGSGDTALPTVEVLSLRAGGSTLYASTRAGIAAYAGLTPVNVPPTTPPPSSGDSGGGLFELRFAALLLAAVWALRRARALG